MGLVLGLTFALFASAPPARAIAPSQVPWSNYQTLIGGSGTLSNWSASTVADSSGNIYVFYDRQGPGGVTSVYVMKYRDVGPGGPVPVAGFPVQVSTVQNVYAGLSPLWSPYGAVDSSGNVYAVWWTINLRVYVSKSTDGGKTWGAQVEVNPAYEEGESLAPSIAFAPNGRLYVAWFLQHPTIGGYLYNISVGYSADGGATFSRPVNVSGGASPPNHWISHPSIAVDSHNRVHVVYSQYFFLGGVPAYANYTRSDDGVTWSPPVTLNTAPYGGANPRIAIDAQDRIHVAWVDSHESGSGSALIYYTSSSDRGQTWSLALPISQGYIPPATGYYLSNVNVATEGSTVLVIWDAGSPTGFIDSVVSTDHGATWDSEGVTYTGATWASLGVDRSGTYYSFDTDMASTPYSIGLTWWHSPPSSVTATVTAATSSLTVSWTAAPENDIAGYRVWRSNDGSTYNLVATVSAGTTSYVNSGLANGTYWYQIEAIDTYGYTGPASPSVIGVVGPTVAQLEDEIASLQSQLAESNASSAAAIAAARAQITALQNQVTQLQSSGAATAAQIASLQANITALQNRLNDLQTQQATQTMSYANLAFEVIVVVLLIVVLLNQMRKPKNPRIMMAQPGEAEPRKSEDEL